jgi:hypothetical protein
MTILLNKNLNDRELKDESSLITTKDSNKVIIVFFILAISLLISGIINLGFIYLSLKLTTQDKIFVTNKGQIEIAEEKDPDFRTDRVIEETISNWLYLTHEWDYPSSNNAASDPGVQLQGEDNHYFKVPSKVYAASYLLEIGFREKFLEELSKSIPASF